MSDLSAYLPQDRRRALLRGKELPDRVTGTALLADVSGFTSLADGLAASLGRRRGAEELTDMLNAVFDALIAPVEAFGGSVVSFAGDAIICWFDSTDDQTLGETPLSRSAERALACALALQRAMASFAAVPLPGGGSAPLAIKVALVAGSARRFVVGDPEIQLLDVLAGRLLDQLGAVAALAAPGKVLVDEATLALLGSAPPIASWHAHPAAGLSAAVVELFDGPPAPRLSTPVLALPDALAAHWVLPAVRERLRVGDDALLAELRPVSVLMLQFGGIDYDHDPAAHAHLDGFLRQVQRELARGEGALLDVMMADQGGYLYAVFGAPVAHEDDSRRAVRAALALCAVPPAGLSTRAGVSQGVLRVGPYGGSSRRAYGVLGDAANLAHRLMSRAAPGEVLASAEVEARLVELFRWEALPPVMLKGKREPVLAFRAIHKRERRPPTPRPEAEAVVGREAECAAIAAAVGRLVKGEGGTLLIEGEPGMGKSRLVAELRAQAAVRGLELLEGGGDAIEQSTPYFAWRPLFRRLLDLEGADVGASPARAEPLLLAASLEPRAPLLNDVLGLQLPDSEFTLQLSGQARADNTHELLLTLLERAAQVAPLLLVLEDIHWLDSASWALLHLVRHHLARALLVVTTRPLTLPSADDERLRAGPQTHVLRLGALTAEEMLELVCRRLGVTRLSPAVAVLLEARVEGNPFFGTELVSALGEAGLIVVEGQECRAAPGVELHTLALPETVQGVIASRVDRLRSEQQLVLKVASVIGRTFAYRTLHDIHPIAEERPAVAGTLEELRQLDLTLLERPEPELSYLFKHVITREATYDLLLYAQRRALHEAVARWYERSYGEPDRWGLAPYYGLLAYHWGHAEQRVRSLRYLDMAGEQALRAGAYREAASFFQQALGLEEGDPALGRARRYRLYGEALLGLGQLAESRAQLEHALVILGEPIRPHSLGWLTRRNAAALLRIVGRSRHRRRRLLHMPQDADMERVRAYQTLGIIYAYFSEGLAATYTTLQAATLLDIPGPLEEQHRLAAAMGMAAGLSSLHPLASAYFRQARAAMGQSSERSSLGFALQAEGLYQTAIAQWQRAYEALDEAVRVAEQLGDRRLFAEVLAHIGTACWFQGNYVCGLEAAGRLRDEAQRSENLVYRVWFTNIAGLCLLRLGRIEEAQGLLEESWHRRHHSGVIGPTRGLTTYGLVELYLQQGRLEEAWTVACDAATQLGRPFPVFYVGLSGYMVLARVACARWASAPHKPAMRLTALMACLQLLVQSWIFPIGRPAAWLHLGHVACLAGQPCVARALWRLSLANAHRLAMPYDEAQAHMELGRASAGGARRRHLIHAIARFARLGATDDLERAMREVCRSRNGT